MGVVCDARRVREGWIDSERERERGMDGWTEKRGERERERERDRWTEKGGERDRRKIKRT